ncbi:glycoside hydrolase family 38 C-terminal domain-containing protein [Actinomycetaceae bacterium MB13-C1-2]|nr:glycoside hydrolase family 38 C-terminal domain-containing protein [Actinomycetaceae bacterium MB13-C1-2]
MHDTSAISLGRIDRFVREWIAPAVVRETEPLSFTFWEAPDEPVHFDEAMTGQFIPGELGMPWGKPWGTTWFHLEGRVPQSWPLPGTRAELLIDLGWIAAQAGFQAEAAAWSPHGDLIKGISPRNHFVPLAPVTEEGKVDLYVEGASNPDVPGGAWTHPTKMGDKATAGDQKIYSVRQLDVALIDTEAEALVADAFTLRSLADVLPENSPRRAEIIVALENMCDAINPDDVHGTAIAGRAQLADALARPAGASVHEAYAVGHAHIDSAWLWPTRETERKVGRTVGNVLALMDELDDFKYAFSSAQQYKWIKEKYPSLYERLGQRVAEGRIVPVGGMWVESDTNMPGGEALARQFVAGKSFFRQEFNLDPASVWLPDSFGYTGFLPQIARQAGMRDMLTQKLTWNDTDIMPHSTFWWEGIDGSRVFTHFPPVATYNSVLDSPEIEKASRDFNDKGLANKSLVPFGYGDGGGGPTREMVFQGRRLANLDGSPKVRMSDPNEFFDDALTQYGEHAPTWIGEMYLEYHRGTYTSQHRTKRGNRRSENLLYEAELWASAATIRTGAEYPYEALSRIWEDVLLMQFHDILPGSSIAWVHRQAEEQYEEIEAELQELIETSLSNLVAGGGVKSELVANASPRPRKGVPAFGIGTTETESPATLTVVENEWILKNPAVKITVDRQGLVTSIYDVAEKREVIPAGEAGNLLQLFRDIPNNWEAWDIEQHYKRVATDLRDVDQIDRVESPDGGPVLRIRRSFSNSTIEQTVWLAPGTDATLHIRTEVDWHEKQKLLKLAFPLDLVTETSESEMQFGFVRRPTHDNTSWDAAKFETVAHRWLRAAESDYGVVLSNDCTYGHDVTRTRTSSGAGTLVRVSLLRAPLFPDPVADQGRHIFHHALSVGATVRDAYDRGYELNLPLRRVEASNEAEKNLLPLVNVVGGVDVATVKLAEDRSGDVILRLFEPRGNRARAELDFDFPNRGVEVVGLLEQSGLHQEFLNPAALDASNGTIKVTLKPFELLTLRVKR